MLFSFSMIIITSPILIVTSVLIKIECLNSPVLFHQIRTGKGNQSFKIYKFRSMKSISRNNSPITIGNDSRITKVGKYIRKFKIDELPQFFSVIKGNMSLVGPRPALYNQDMLIALRKECGVDKLLPGITGWSQVNGRDDLSIIDKITLDKEYIDLCSFWFDVRIMWLTLLKVLKREGVAH